MEWLESNCQWVVFIKVMSYSGLTNGWWPFIISINCLIGWCLAAWTYLFTLYECNNLSTMICIFICVSVYSGWTDRTDNQTQCYGDRFNFPWNTHDPLGCAAVGALSEVLFLSLTELTCWLLRDSLTLICAPSHTQLLKATSLHTCFIFYLPHWAAWTLSCLLTVDPTRHQQKQWSVERRS